MTPYDQQDPLPVSRPIGLMVCSFCPIPEFSGGRKRTARLAESMARAGLEPHLLSLADDMGVEAQAAMRERGWVPHAREATASASIHARVRQHLLALPRPASPALTMQLRALAARAAVVQFEDIWAVQHALDSAVQAPVVVSLYNVESTARAGGESAAVGLRERVRNRWRLARIASVERRGVRRADLTVCVSQADRRHFAAMGARELLLVPNGVDEHLFELPDTPGREGRVLFFGQLEYRPNAEGIERFIRRGWPTVRAQEPDAVLRIAGQGASPTLVKLAAATKGVELIGFIEDLELEIASARAVVAPIRFGGGTRIKVLEAMAAARPVVGTPLAVEEIGFVDRQHGLISDDDETIGEALVALLRDAALSSRLGLESRRHARAYAWTRVTRPLDEYYADVAARGLRSRLSPR